MSTTPTLAIIGASLTGAKAAEAAGDAGFDGRIVLIGEEPGQPYERPPLSKAVLGGEKDADTARVHPEEFYDEHDIELVNDHADTLDPASRTIGLTGGQTIGFDTTVLANGAAPRRLDIPGADLADVHYLRTIDDSERTGVAELRGTKTVEAVVLGDGRVEAADVVVVGACPYSAAKPSPLCRRHTPRRRRSHGASPDSGDHRPTAGSSTGSVRKSMMILLHRSGFSISSP